MAKSGEKRHEVGHTRSRSIGTVPTLRLEPGETSAEHSTRYAVLGDDLVFGAFRVGVAEHSPGRTPE